MTVSSAREPVTIIALYQDTAPTITFRFDKTVRYENKQTIAFVDGGSSNDQITDSANGFVSAGFVKGQKLQYSGGAKNEGTQTIQADVTAGVIEVPTNRLQTEAAGAYVSLVAEDVPADVSGYTFSLSIKADIDDTADLFTITTGFDVTDAADGIVKLTFTTAHTLNALTDHWAELRDTANNKMLKQFRLNIYKKVPA